MKLIKLGNLTSIQTGKIDVNKAVAGGKYPFFTCSRDVYEIDEAPYEGKAVLVAGNGDLNVKYYEGKFNAYQRTYFLFVNDENELIPRYLYWFLESYVGQLRSDSIGSTIKYIKMGNLTEAEIPLLSLDKQREIVEMLDTAFAEIDLFESNLSLIDEKTNQLLQSLLSAAFNSIETREELNKSVANREIAGANKVFNEFHNMFSVIPDSQTKIKSSSYLESGRYAVVDQGKALIAGYTDSNPTVNNDLLPVIVFGDHTRTVKYIDFPFAAGADGTQILKPSSITEPKYAFYSVLTAVSKIPSKGYARHFGDLKKMLFPIPALEVQQAIIEKMDSAFAEIELFKRQIKIEQDQATELRQSLLGRVFTREEATA